MNLPSHFFAGAVIAASLSSGFAADSPAVAPEVQWADTSDNTPLHLAVLRGDADAVDALLAQGADAAAVNSAGATPLHYATANERMVTALLAHGAPVNAVSKWSVNPLWAAVVHPDSFAVVRQLVAAGADIKYNPWNQVSLILNNAIQGGDPRTVELLLDHGAELNPATGELPLFTAAFNGDFEIVKLLLTRGAGVNGRDGATEFQPLGAALWMNHNAVARLLIEHGADVHGRIPFPNVGPTLMVMSAYNDALDPTVARLLVEHGADINSTDENGETALSYALKRGSDNPLVAYLRAAGAKESTVPRRAKTIPTRDVPTDPTARTAMVRDSVQRAITLIQPSSKAFLEIPMVRDQQKCTSCHQQELPNVAIALARERGLHVDEHELGRALHALKASISNNTEGNRQTGPNLPLNPLVLGYVFDDMHTYGFERDSFTDALARSLLDFQCPDGHWRAPVRRPPMEDGSLVATAWSARALQLYPPSGREHDAGLALGRARAWLAAQPLRDLNDRIFQLLGLAWTNETVVHLQPLAEQLIALQQTDGGWTQFPSLECDSWATGSALVALHTAGVPTSHPAYQRGVTFLLRTQFDDGSWWVRSRTIPIQPQFNGRFPHGKDQWISASGTSWAMIALLLTLDPMFDPGELSTAKQLIAAFAAAPPAMTAKDLAAASEAIPPATANTGAIAFARDIQPIFERSCVGCHSGEQAKASFDLTTRASLLKGGQNGEPAIVPGYADDSQLFQFVSGLVEDLEMPPLNKRHKYPGLSSEEIDQFRAWIDAGAPWPAAISARTDPHEIAGAEPPARN